MEPIYSLVQESVSPAALMQKGDTPFVFLFCYGALMDVGIFKERLLPEYEDEGEDIDRDYNKFFAGMYKMPCRKLVFTKNKDGKGRGHITIGADNQYVIGAMMIVPKSALRFGSDLMTSEGAFSNDGYAHQNHYTLCVNSHLPFEPLLHEEMTCPVIPTHGAFYFVAGYTHVDAGVTADPEYLNTLITVLKGRVNEGWEIPTGYIRSIQDQLR